MSKPNNKRFNQLRKNWNAFGEQDPMWAILTQKGKKGNKWEKEPFFRSGNNEINRVLKYVNTLEIDLKKNRALDFGCGLGRLTQALARHFKFVDGVDVASSMITQANAFNQFPGKVHYHLNEKPNLKVFPDDHFDFIYSNITLQHIPKPYIRPYIQELIRVLEPGGLLIFQMPSDINWKKPDGKIAWNGMVTKWVYQLRLDRIYRRLRYMNQPIMEINLLRKDEVLSVLTEAGAQALDIVPNKSAGQTIEGYRYSITK